MKIYSVGGAVRDQLLGIPHKDQDYVVVGATPQDMLDLGYTQVGADFPVFLHPESGEEYALARQERKTGPGYHGFETRFDPDVTIEQDLLRRDLTINAMAVDGHGNLIDPYGGVEDINEGVLRHVSEAFAEDPVRVLRVARFAARFDFDVHESTMDLMRELVDAGELDHLTPERVWSEFERAMLEEHPRCFFWALMTMTLFEADLIDRMMVVFSSISVSQVDDICDRYKAPSNVKSMSRKFNILMDTLYLAIADPVRALDLFKTLNAYKHPDRFFKMAKVIMCAIGNKDIMRLLVAFRESRKVTFRSLTIDQQQTLKGSDISLAMDALRLGAIRQSL